MFIDGLSNHLLLFIMPIFHRLFWASLYMWIISFVSYFAFFIFSTFIFLSHYLELWEPRWVKALTRDIFILLLVLKEISQFSIKSAVGFPWIILSLKILFPFLLGLEFLFLDRGWMLPNTFFCIYWDDHFFL